MNAMKVPLTWFAGMICGIVIAIVASNRHVQRLDRRLSFQWDNFVRADDQLAGMIDQLRSEDRFDMVGLIRVSQPGDKMFFTPNGQGKVFRCVTPGFGGWGQTEGDGALVRISGRFNRDNEELLVIEDLDNIRVPDTVNHINWPGNPS